MMTYDTDKKPELIWSAEVHDLIALVRHVAKHPDLVSLLRPNRTMLNGVARKLRNSIEIPGVTAVARRDVRSRGS